MHIVTINAFIYTCYQPSNRQHCSLFRPENGIRTSRLCTGQELLRRNHPVQTGKLFD